LNTRPIRPSQTDGVLHISRSCFEPTPGFPRTKEMLVASCGRQLFQVVFLRKTCSQMAPHRSDTGGETNTRWIIALTSSVQFVYLTPTLTVSSITWATWESENGIAQV